MGVFFKLSLVKSIDHHIQYYDYQKRNSWLQQLNICYQTFLKGTGNSFPILGIFLSLSDKENGENKMTADVWTCKRLINACIDIFIE